MPCLFTMSGKTQLRLLVSVALVFFAILLLYSLFFTQPVKLYSIAATEPGSDLSQSKGEHNDVPNTSSEVIGLEKPLKIDLNTATKADLMKIDGIGEVLASRIIEYRNTNGSFNNVNELIRVDGIGEAKLEPFRQVLYVP